jgi:drug/metabolite transporter (DMT)-like permease
MEHGTRLFSALIRGILANFLWGLAFLIPYALSTVDPLLIAVGRYGCYGVLSLLLISTGHRDSIRNLGPYDWLWAVGLALTGNVGYYALLIMSIRYGGVCVTALIIGALPVTMALYGNWSEREVNLRRLAPPLVLILAGLVAMNGYKFAIAPSNSAARTLVLGIAFAIAALGLWTWYGVKNAQYLRRHPLITGRDWSNAVGVATLASMALILPLITAIGAWSPMAALASIGSRESLLSFVAMSLILGVVVSWLTTVLWNSATRVLPVSLAGQLVVFETLSSVLYASLLDRALPHSFEVGCMVLILFGVLLGVRATLRSHSLETGYANAPRTLVVVTASYTTSAIATQSDIPNAGMIDDELSKWVQVSSYPEIDSGYGTAMANTSITTCSYTNDLADNAKLTAPTQSSVETIIQGSSNRLTTTSVTLHFCSGSNVDPVSFGEGRIQRSSKTVTIDGNDDIRVSVTVTRSTVQRPTIKATLSDPSGNGSDFSQDMTVAVGSAVRPITHCPDAVSIESPARITFDTVRDGIKMSSITNDDAILRNMVVDI